MFFHLTKKSSNVKTGKIPVSTSDKATCPNSCSIKEACYASCGHLNMHWDKVSEGKNNATNWDGFITSIKANIPEGQLWRHNQAGDLNGSNERINADALKELVKANKGKMGFTYTHYPVIAEQYDGDEPNEANEVAEANMALVKDAIANGFTINASADNLEMAEKLFAEGLPVCSVVSEDAPIKGTTKNGTRYIVCPAQVFDDKTCMDCALCQKANRKMIIAFQVHGSKKGNYEG